MGEPMPGCCAAGTPKARLVRGAGLLAPLVAATVACGDDPARVVAVPGCGLDTETDPTSVRIRIRGDFPPRSDHQIVLGAGEEGTLQSVPGQAEGITVEGLFGDDEVVAVGRTARVRGTGELPVYYAPPWSLCPVESGVVSRRVGAAAAGEEGDVLMVGGVDERRALTTELVTFDDETGIAELAAGTISIPSTGQTVHPLGRHRFVIVGGAGAGTVLSSALTVDLGVAPSRDPVAEQPILLNVAGETQPRAHHAGVTLSDGVTLVTGGCGRVDELGTCIAPDGEVLASAFYLAEEGDELALNPAPPLSVPRFGHVALVARDDVVIVAGGIAAGGEPVTAVERLVPGADGWEILPHDPGDAPGGAQPLAGAGLMEGGTLILVRADGSLAWATPTAGGVLPSPSLPAAERRGVTVLPGDRVLVDTFLFSALAADTAGPGAGDVLDLATRAGRTPLPPREGSAQVLLADGTVLFAGGLDLDDGDPVRPFLLRLRPPLDGPDEDLPRLGDPGNFITNDPDAIRVDGSAVTLTSEGAVEPFPSHWIHMRGIRSASFRLEATLERDGGRPYVVLLRGALEAVALALDEGRVAVSFRDASGTVDQRSCEGSRGFVGGALRVDVHGETVELSDDEGEVGVCEVGLRGPFAAGFAVSGSGSVVVDAVRVART